MTLTWLHILTCLTTLLLFSTLVSCALNHEDLIGADFTPSPSAVIQARQNGQPKPPRCFYRYERPLGGLLRPYYDVEFRLPHARDKPTRCGLSTWHAVAEHCSDRGSPLKQIPDLRHWIPVPVRRVYPILGEPSAWAITRWESSKLCSYFYRMVGGDDDSDAERVFDCIKEALTCEYGDDMPRQCVSVFD